MSTNARTRAEKQHRARKVVAGGVLAIAALAGLVAFRRSLPDLKRYLRVERM